MKTPTQLLKHTLISTLVMASVAFTTGAHADASCGQGKIEEIVEGGWNFDDLMIKLSSSPTGATGLWFGYVRYQAAVLGAERMRGLRSIAYLAMAGDKTVVGLTHNTNCTSATQLTIKK